MGQTVEKYITANILKLSLSWDDPFGWELS